MLRVSGRRVAAPLHAATVAAKVAAIIVAIAVGLTACSEASPAPTRTARPSPTVHSVTGDGILTVGTLFPLTGQLSFLGPALTAGVDTAVSEINADGGYDGKPVVVVHQDSGDTAAVAAAGMAALVKAGADVVVGPSSSVLVQDVLPAAAAAHIPLITPAATFPGLATTADAGYLFRTIPTYATQAFALAQAIPSASRRRVAILYSADSVGTSLARALPVALKGVRGAVVSSVPIASSDTGYAALVATVAASTPDAVVLATEGGATPQTLGLINALTAAKLGGASLWLTSQNIADYSTALTAGTLAGVNGVLEGAAPDAGFLAEVAKVHPGLGSTLYAAESYDATILAALSAASAHDDGGPAIDRKLRATSEGGITCASWTECTTVLKTDSDIDYGGVSGPVDLGPGGDLTSAYYGIYRYSTANTYARVSTILVQ